MFIIRLLLIIVIILKVSKSEEECLIEECGQVLQACSASEICAEALSQVYDVCESVEQCTDQNYVNTELCQLNDECAQQIVTIASCFIDNCEVDSDVDIESEQTDHEEEENETKEAAELIGEEPNYNNTEETTTGCFENLCAAQLELCVVNEGCNNVLNNADELCLDGNFQCLNEEYVETVACNGYNGCKELVLGIAHCYYQNCNDECITQQCHESLITCINSENCNQGLELAYSGKCEEIDCLDHDAQLNILCNGYEEAAVDFNVLATCYYDNCSTDEIKEEHNGYKGYGSTQCIAESGYHAYLDEYGNCCAGLDRIDCLWNLEESNCGWFYHKGDGYCYSWQGAENCGSFKQQAIMAAPVSCFFEDCFVDSCNKIIDECKNNEDCAIALNKYTYEGSTDYTLCGSSTECVQIFDKIITCLNDNCIKPIEPEPTSGNKFTSTQEPENTLIEEQQYTTTVSYENETTEKPKLKEKKVLIENKAINK